MEPLVFRATDIDEMASAFEGWQMDVIQQECGKFQGRLNGYSAAEGKINFYSAAIDRRVFANGHHLPGSVMFTFIECPNACTWNGEEVHQYKLFISDAERGLDLDAGKGFISYSSKHRQTTYSKSGFGRRGCLPLETGIFAWISGRLSGSKLHESCTV